MTALRIRQLPCNSINMLVVVESIRWEQHKFDTGCSAYGLLEPVAVIVGKRYDIQAFDMNAKPTDLARLKEQLPELDTTITSFLKQTIK